MQHDEFARLLNDQILRIINADPAMGTLGVVHWPYAYDQSDWAEGNANGMSVVIELVLSTKHPTYRFESIVDGNDITVRAHRVP